MTINNLETLAQHLNKTSDKVTLDDVKNYFNENRYEIPYISFDTMCGGMTLDGYFSLDQIMLLGDASKLFPQKQKVEA
jgi:hypothetical protein